MNNLWSINSHNLFLLTLAVFSTLGAYRFEHVSNRSAINKEFILGLNLWLAVLGTIGPTYDKYIFAYNDYMTMAPPWAHLQFWFVCMISINIMMSGLIAPRFHNSLNRNLGSTASNSSFLYQLYSGTKGALPWVLTHGVFSSYLTMGFYYIVINTVVQEFNYLSNYQNSIFLLTTSFLIAGTIITPTGTYFWSKKPNSTFNPLTSHLISKSFTLTAFGAVAACVITHYFLLSLPVQAMEAVLKNLELIVGFLASLVLIIYFFTEFGSSVEETEKIIHVLLVTQSLALFIGVYHFMFLLINVMYRLAVLQS